MIKRIFFSVLVILTVLAVTACGKHTECKDADGDGICDGCNETIMNTNTQIGDVVLIEDGVADFQVVLAKDISEELFKTANTEIRAFLRNEYGIAVDVIIEGREQDVAMPKEILIGEVKSRGEEYQNKDCYLRNNDYFIKTVGTKIVINAGSPDKLKIAVTEFAKLVLETGSAKKTVMTKDNSVISISSDYAIDSLKLCGNDMKDYKIATDLSSKYYSDGANLLQKLLAEKAGFRFQITDISEAADKAIIIRHSSDVLPENSFKISADGENLLIECAHDNALEVGINGFIKSVIDTAGKEVNLNGTVYAKDISVLYYEDFGAVGDGKTNDFKAMYDAHVCANEGGQTVKGTPGATYYIKDTRIPYAGGVTVVTIPIRTNTDWQGAKIIIDDSEVASLADGPNYDLSRYNIFSIIPDEEHEGFNFTNETVLDAIVAEGLNPDTKQVNLKIDGWDGPVMIIPYNSEHKVFRRLGYTRYDGESMHEVIVLDADGNVSPETPIMFEYTNLDYVTVYKLDPESAISVGNATIETIDTRINHNLRLPSGSYKYHTGYRKRGISVTRSYTTVHDVKHIVSGGFNLLDRSVGLAGSAANGMFTAQNANHVTFKDCIIPGRQAYGESGSYTGHSSYNFNAVCVNKIVLDGCIQSNFWVTVNKSMGTMTPSTEYVEGALPSMSIVKINGENMRMHWGIGGTNYCKNMEYLNSQISRFDAHAGLYNGKVINTKINMMSLTGYGDMILENVDWYQHGTTWPLLYFRDDYGYHWDGNVTIKDTRAHLYDLGSGTPVFYLAMHRYTNWYWGYTTAIPNFTVDNLDIYSTKNQAPVDSGFVANLFYFRSNAKTMHLSGSGIRSTVYSVIDDDGDGYIDEPLYDANLDGRINDADRIDVDGDGKIGNTSLKMSDYSSLSESFKKYGVSHPNSKTNVNVVKPPRFIKIINNDGVDGTGGYIFKIVNTAGQGISDGGWYRDKEAPDTYGGFFGNTKFIYGEGADDFFYGTDHEEQTETTTFKFVSKYY